MCSPACGKSSQHEHKQVTTHASARTRMHKRMHASTHAHMHTRVCTHAHVCSSVIPLAGMPPQWCTNAGKRSLQGRRHFCYADERAVGGKQRCEVNRRRFALHYNVKLCVGYRCPFDRDLNLAKPPPQCFESLARIVNFAYANRVVIVIHSRHRCRIRCGMRDGNDSLRPECGNGRCGYSSQSLQLTPEMLAAHHKSNASIRQGQLWGIRWAALFAPVLKRSS